jgi:protein-disulfide isomerase
MRKEIKILGAIAIIVILAAIVGAHYYRNALQSERVTTNTHANTQERGVGQLVHPDSPTLGAAAAPVTIVEFLDPECESCRAFHPTVKKMLKDYHGKVRLVVRYMPLHPHSMLAASFTEAAGEQGKYWQAQELLFQRQPEWGERHGQPAALQPGVKSLFAKYAVELELDLEKLHSAMAQNKFAAKLERDKKDGQSLGVRQTPTLFVNGRKLARLHETDLKSLIEEELRK